MRTAFLTTALSVFMLCNAQVQIKLDTLTGTAVGVGHTKVTAMSGVEEQMIEWWKTHHYVVEKDPAHERPRFMMKLVNASIASSGVLYERQLEFDLTFDSAQNMIMAVFTNMEYSFKRGKGEWSTTLDKTCQDYEEDLERRERKGKLKPRKPDLLFDLESALNYQLNLMSAALNKKVLEEGN